MTRHLAHALRRAAQALRLAADLLDPPLRTWVDLKRRTTSSSSSPSSAASSRSSGAPTSARQSSRSRSSYSPRDRILVPLRPCLTCGALSPNSRCPTHAHLSTGARGSTRRSRTTRTQIIERDGYTCQRCGKPVTGGRDTHVDHLVRKRDGGSDDPTNLLTTCATCNLTRG